MTCSMARCRLTSQRLCANILRSARLARAYSTTFPTIPTSKSGSPTVDVGHDRLCWTVCAAAFANRATILGPPARPGDLGTLGPYDIEAEVGHGSTGVVYRARDRTMGRVVALKILRRELAQDDARDRFVREVARGLAGRA